MEEPPTAHARNARPVRKGRFVLYWMQAAQRASWNPALEHAIQRANALHVPPLVLFVIVPDYPEANARHYRFLLEGMGDVATELHRRGIAFALRMGEPLRLVPRAAEEACSLVMDAGYTRVQRQWRERVAAAAPCRAEEVETEVVVPTVAASTKEEWSAATLRRKVQPLLERYLVPPTEERPQRRPLTTLPLADEGAETAAVLLSGGHPVFGPAAERVPPVEAHYRGGLTQARRRLDRFLGEALPAYAALRGDPSLDASSHLSPYLHFGQISPLEVALRATEAGERPGESAFLEELIVRRELATNFVLHSDGYDRYDGLPEWCRRTLEAHRADPRPYLYSLEEMEEAATHDLFWNAAMLQMRQTGWLHNTMRMYWGKKLLEWSPTPEEAFARALLLNNRWFLDGRDPNSFAGVAWCFGKHDRPWPERPVFGTVRSMTEGGLRRKYDMDTFVRRAAEL
jgi:deoxyribodipyrimidine photo-lyase